MYGLFGGDIEVAPVNTSTGAIGPAVEADAVVDPVFSEGSAFQYGNFVYVIGFDQLYASLSLWKFSITGAQGQLTESNDSPMNISGGDPLLDLVHGRLYVFGTVIQGGGGQAFNLWGYTLNAQTGSFGGSVSYSDKIPAGTFLAPAIDPLGRFIYEIAATPAGGAVYVYLIDPSTGSLSEAAGSPFTVIPPSNPFSMAQLTPSPSGKFLYLYASGSTNLGSPFQAEVYALSVNATTGALTPVPGSPFGTDTNIGNLAISPGGNALYSQAQGPFQGPGQIDAEQVFSLDPVQGTVGTSPLSTFLFSNEHFFGTTAVDPSGSLLISANVTGNNLEIYSFTINSSTGALTPVSGSPFTMVPGLGTAFLQNQPFLIVKIP